MTMKEQIALELAKADKIRQIRLDFQAEMKALAESEEEKILVGLLQNNGGN